MEEKNDKKTKYNTNSRILQRLVNNKKIPMLFIGSGISKRYLKNYPNWDELLFQIAQIIEIDENQLLAIKQTITDNNPLATKCSINKKIAQFLTEELRNKIIKKQIEIEKIFDSKDLNYIHKYNVPFIKKLISKYFSNYDVYNTKKLKNELKELRKLESKIPIIITTNYDEFIEKSLFSNFKCFYDQNQYFRADTEGIGEIYKIHGSVLYPNSLIFNDEDYEKFNKYLRVVAAKILILLLDYPIIFLGYSLEDENVLEILKTLIDCLNQQQLKDLENSFIYVQYKQNEFGLKESTKMITANDGKTIKLSVIETDNYFAIYKYLQKFQPSIQPTIVRKYKSIIKELVNETNTGNQKIFVKEEDIDKLKDDNNLVIAFGSKNEISEKGITGFEIKDMINEILQQKKITKKYAGEIIYKRYIQKTNITIKQFVPIFYYTKVNNEYDNNDKIQNLKQRTNNYIKSLNNNQKIKMFDNIDELNKYLTTEKLLSKKIETSTKAFANNKISYENFIVILNNLKEDAYNRNSYTTEFNKAITYADLK